MRSSPCTGMNALGCTSASIILSSSAEPWPETCTASLSWCSTRAPRRQSAFIVSCTASSLPGHGLGRHDDRVALPDLHLAVVAVGHARERRHRLALRAGAEHGDLVVAQLVEVGRLDQRALLDVGVAEVARDVEVLDHRAAHDGDLAAAGLGGVDDALQAVDVRREARHDHAAGRVADDALERGCDELLGLRDARALGVRGVGQHQVDAVGAEPRELGEIGRPAVDRRVVDLVVARVQDRARRWCAARPRRHRAPSA